MSKVGPDKRESKVGAITALLSTEAYINFCYKKHKVCCVWDVFYKSLALGKASSALPDQQDDMKWSKFQEREREREIQEEKISTEHQKLDRFRSLVHSNSR